MADPVAKHEALMAELTNSPRKLASPQATNDKSGPFIEPGLHLEKFPKQELLSEIQHGAPLHHVEAGGVRDASAPVIDKDVVLRKNPHGELMEEVRTKGTHHAAMVELKQVHEGGVPLKHVTTVDKAAPVISPDVRLTPDTHPALLQEVLHHAPLSHVDPSLQHDTSGPVLQPGVGLASGPDPRAAVLQEVRSGGVSLKHVDQVHDTSVPAVTKTAAMRVAGGPADTA